MQHKNLYMRSKPLNIWRYYLTSTLKYLIEFTFYFKLMRQKVSLTILGTQSYNLYTNIYHMTYLAIFYHIKITYKNLDMKNYISHFHNFITFLDIYL